MSDLVGDPEDRFSRITAHLYALYVIIILISPNVSGILVLCSVVDPG